MIYERESDVWFYFNLGISHWQDGLWYPSIKGKYVGFRKVKY